MKFSAIASFALFALASAELRKVPRSSKDKAVFRRQTNVNVQTAAMTDGNGNVVPFDTAGVVQPMKAAGN